MWASTVVDEMFNHSALSTLIPDQLMLLTVLDDINTSEACETWQNYSDAEVIIIDDGSDYDIYNLFQSSSTYSPPAYIFLDQDMTITKIYDTEIELNTVVAQIASAFGNCDDSEAVNVGEVGECVFACEDPIASNYNQEPYYDDGRCEYIYDHESSDDQRFASFENDILSIFNNYGCTGCHNPDMLPWIETSLDLTTYQNFMTTGDNFGESIVNLDDPVSSPIYELFKNEVSGSISFESMGSTTNGGNLTDFNNNGEVDGNDENYRSYYPERILAWIEQGARETTASYDCAGEPEGDAVLSGCDNACESILELDECGECGGDGIDEGCSDCECASIDKNIIPNKLQILNSYPNPFNPQVTIEYQLSYYSDLEIEIYNARGQIVNNEIILNNSPGYYSYTWDAINQSSGIYIILFKSDSNTISHKVMLLK